MSSKITAVNFGLSSAERKDLQQLIRANRQKAGEPREDAALRRELRMLRDKNQQMARFILDLDKKVGLLYELVSLAQMRNELVNQSLGLASPETAEKEGV